MIISDIELEYGVDGFLTVQVKDSTTNLPINLTGYGVKFYLGEDHKLKLTELDSEVVNIDDQGNVTVKFPAAATLDLNNYPFYNIPYFLDIISSLGEVTRAAKGFLQVS